MPTARLALPSPAGFSFATTVRSHGWYDLPPFRLDDGGRTLALSLETAPGRVVRATLTEAGGAPVARLDAPFALAAADRKAARAALAAILQLDEDLEPFYALTGGEPRLAWVRALGAGRLLRAPTVWEDLVKMIFTTNCSWALTRSMVSNLVEAIGPGDAETGRAFPGPAAMASERERFYRDVVRCGYRAPFLVELARRVAAGRLDPERWRSPAVSTAELDEELASVKGVGPYAAGQMMRLLGHYDRLALDSWCRAKWSKRFAKRRASDRTIERFYRRFGAWQGLVLWMDVTADWFAGEE